MKPRILAIYYTQSGQLRDILDNLTKDIKDEAEIDFVNIEPVTAFPFPWKAYTFFDAMPETVERIASPVKPLPEAILNKDYDLVILGYQTWFLHPSQPVTSFLKSDQAKKLLAGKPVLTVIGCRNMWLNGQEKVKEDLLAIGAKLVGNIALVDTNPNLVSTLTVIRWAFKGQKEPSRFLPAAGVQDKDIKETQRFGKPILEYVTGKKLDKLQDKLLAMEAINLKPGLILLEQRGIKNFRFWSKFIREKGGPGDLNRSGRVNAFKRLLIVAIFILSPISSFTAFIQLQLNKKKLLKDVDYFRSLGYEQGRI